MALLLLCVALWLGKGSSLEVMSSTRTVDSSQYVTSIVDDILLINTLDVQVNQFKHLISSGKSLVYMGVKFGKNQNFTFFDFSTAENYKSLKIVTIALSNVEPGKQFRLFIKQVYIRAVKAFPKQIKQFERNSLKFRNNKYFDSVYLVHAQSAKFICGKCEIIDKSDLVYSSVVGRSEIEFKIDDQVEPGTFETFFVVFQPAFQCVTRKLLHKRVFISEYSFTKIEETHVIENDAGAIVGEHTRALYNENPMPLHVLTSISFVIPGSASNIRYIDQIGNISSSQLFHTKNDQIKLIIKPRFVIYGGWNTEFTISYDVPTDSIVKIDPETKQRSLDMVLGTSDLDFKPTLEMITEFILPEYSWDMKVKSDFPDVKVTNLNTNGYLDFYGRPTLRILSFNMIVEKSLDVHLSYKHSFQKLLYKPLYSSLTIFAGFFIILAALMMTKSKPNVDYENLLLSFDFCLKAIDSFVSNSQICLKKASKVEFAGLLVVNQESVRSISDRLPQFSQMSKTQETLASSVRLMGGIIDLLVVERETKEVRTQKEIRELLAKLVLTSAGK